MGNKKVGSGIEGQINILSCWNSILLFLYNQLNNALIFIVASRSLLARRA